MPGFIQRISLAAGLMFCVDMALRFFRACRMKKDLLGKLQCQTHDASQNELDLIPS
jgi:hypothetical protein